MRKFEKKINELNLVKGKLSKALNSNIKDFEMLEQSLVGLHAELREAEAKENNEDEVEKLTQESEELEEQLENFDGGNIVLTEKVQTYADNYDSYQERIRKMDEGRKAKAAAKSQQTAAVEPAPAPQPEPIVEPAPQAAPPPPPPAPKEEEKEKKGTNWVLWGVLGVAGIFLGINLYKNKR